MSAGMPGIWRLGARNLLRNRRRTLSTGLSVAFGFVGLVMVTGYITRVERRLRIHNIYLMNNGHLSIYKENALERQLSRPALYSFTPAEQRVIQDELKSDSKVDFVAPYLKGKGLIGNGCKTVPFGVVGTDPEALRRIRENPRVREVAPDLSTMARGRELWEYGKVQGAIALAGGLAELLDKRMIHDDLRDEARSLAPAVPNCSDSDIARQLGQDDNVQLLAGSYSGGISAVDGEIVALFHTGYEELEYSLALTSIQTLQQLYGTDQISYYAVFLKDPRDIRKKAVEFQGRLRRRGLNVQVYPWNSKEISPMYVGFMKFLRVLGGFIYLTLSLVVGLSIMNSVIMTAIERMREVGTLRAIGFTPAQVCRIFQWEAATLSIVSIALGSVLATGLVWLINASNFRFSPPGSYGTVQLTVTPTPLTYLIVAALLVTITSVMALVAVRRRVKWNVISLLQSGEH